MARIVIMTDHKWRDLPGNVYLKLILEKKYNHKVILVRLGEDTILNPSFKPDMVVYNNLYDENKNAYARYLSKKGVKIAVLPTEGITFSEQQTLLFSHKHAGIDFVDMYMAWNPLMSNAMSNYKVLPKDSIKILGCGRFDFYSNHLSSLLKDRQYFKDKYSVAIQNTNILVTTNFANAEFWPDTQFLKKDLERQRASGIPAFSDAERLAKYEHDYRERMFEVVGELSRHNKNVNILLKYHPSERISVYHDFASTLKKINKNVFLIEGEYLWDVLNISDIVLQRCSTVAVEAWLLSKQTVEIELMPSLEHFLQPRYKSGSWVVKTGKELVDTVQKILCKPEYIPKVMLDARKKLLEQIIHRPDGKATERVAYELDRLSGDAGKIDGRISYLTMRNWIKSVIRRTLGMKGYDYAANLSRFKIGDYLGRYNKSYTARDEVFWGRKLARFVAKK